MCVPMQKCYDACTAACAGEQPEGCGAGTEPYREYTVRSATKSGLGLVFKDGDLIIGGEVETPWEMLLILLPEKS